MAFFRGKQGREQLSTTGFDEKDNVVAGIKFNVVFLGSMLVPTPTGHGSSRTESAVEKIYHEKYKAFGYGSRKVSLEISSDEIKVFENSSGKEIVQTAGFRTVDITYCNSDLKHEKAFVFVVADATVRGYRAYVFHCDSTSKVRELLGKFKEAFTVKGSQLEATRLRSYSAPPPDRQVYNQSQNVRGASPEQQSEVQNEEEWGTFQENKHENYGNQRQRSQTELVNVKNSITRNNIGQHSSNDNVDHDDEIMNTPLRNDEDEFTLLAEKRLRSFDEKGKAGTGESLLLLESNITDATNKNLFMGGKHINVSKPESENLLQF